MYIFLTKVGDVKKVFVTFACLGLVASAALVGCGGGGAGGTAVSPVVLKGVMLDSPVEGIGYRTETQQGLTDKDGFFNYVGGETVTFSIYGTVIGSTSAASVNTPLDLLGNGTLVTYTANILRLLQSLDEDNNLSNGIKLPQLDFNKEINFDQTSGDFQSDPVVVELLQIAGNRSLVSKSDALNHFNLTTTTNELVSNYTIDLIGKKVTETIVDSNCPSKSATIVTKFFSATDIEMVSTDFNPGTCDNRTETRTYNNIETFRSEQFVTGDPYSCWPLCTFSELNSFYEYQENNERFQRMGAHILGSNTIQHIFNVLDQNNEIVEQGTSTGIIEPLSNVDSSQRISNLPS